MVATLRVLTLVAALSVAASPVSADPITITGGALTWMPPAGGVYINLQSDDFTFIGGGPLYVFLPWGTCLSGACRLGGTLDLLTTFTGGDLGGTATFDGQTFQTGIAAGSASMFTRWTGQLPIPADYTIGEPLAAPFDFTGSFSFPFPFSGGRIPLVGSGTATATFQPYGCCAELYPGALRLESIRYDFAPTPEPTSMLLIGTGLAGIVAARARRRRRSPSTE